MIGITQFFADLANPQLSFLAKALLVAVLSSVTCGAVGCHVIIRGMSFIGDAVAHAVFPGIAIAFVFSGSLLLGGAVAGIIVAVLVAVLAQNQKVREDAIIGILFAASFAVGVVIISRAQGYTGSLMSFMFGSITGIPNSDLLWVGIVTIGVLAVLALFHKKLVAVALDREMAQAKGLRVLALDILLYVAVACAVVISVRTIGNVLVLALLIAPAAAARLLTNDLPTMMVVAGVIGAVSSFVGLYVSWSADLPTGATIVLVATAAFLAALTVSRIHRA
ncbi:MAG: anchored repeat-type ABC transporter permease subunit [Actinomycetaceae bacterium]|nr:anchored repeat-type ABC transporter permease subunit [Actinomycetaceae bacterium]